MPLETRCILRATLYMTGRYQRECRGRTQAHPTALKHSPTPQYPAALPTDQLDNCKIRCQFLRNQKPGHVLTLAASVRERGGATEFFNLHAKEKKKQKFIKLCHTNL